MNGVLELLTAIIDLVRTLTQVPDDWNEEADVVGWLEPTNRPLAKVITLLVPDDEDVMARFESLPVLMGRLLMARRPVPTGDPKADWDATVDWVIDLLIWAFPEKEDMLNWLCPIVKQVLYLILQRAQEQEAATPEAVRVSLGNAP